MKKSYIAICAVLAPAAAFAQSAIDALQISQPDFKGTARYMSMGGAFTALGGDLSSVNQNPAGLGLYRRSEIGATLGLDFQKAETPFTSIDFPNSVSQTKASCNNFGYVGSTLLDGDLRTLNWGVSYSRAASFDRSYCGYAPRTMTSLSNYIAAFTGTTNPANMEFGDIYNPYFDSDIDWLSILAYNSYMISPVGGGYIGLFDSRTLGDALYSVTEKGYIDEYNISVGGNVQDLVYWGLNIGINDLQYKRYAFYSESMANALVPADEYADQLVNGSAGFDLDNFKYINGSGWNLKLGIIIKPINELRIGLAVHTPTWYQLNHNYDAGVKYAYTPEGSNMTLRNPDDQPWEETEQAYFEWKLAAPWKFMAGVAAVLGQNVIVSADYEFDGYNSMRMSTPLYDAYNYITGYVSNDAVNAQIKSYYKNSHVLKLGAEYRVTPQFSVRAGYNVRSSISKEDANSGGVMEVVTSGTDPSYSFDQTIQNFCFGLGYKYKAWYIDAAYVYKNRKSTYHAYTGWGEFNNWHYAPQSELENKDSQFIISTGFKF